MKINWFFVFAIVLAVIIIALTSILHNTKNDPIIYKWSPHKDVVEMPVVRDTKLTPTTWSIAPQPDRGPEYREFLAASLRINVRGARGSGTICFYNKDSGWAYVISCGHLWSGNRSYEELRNNPVEAEVTTWYHNNKKLESPRDYEAEVLFWSNRRGYDVSCLRFQPDWQPNYFPIAPLDYNLNRGMNLHSCGCDGGREVARYAVEFVEYRGRDLITRKNSPRPGRSGGGLLTNDGWYVAICWGTSDTTTGRGIGYFTPLESIYEVYKSNKHGWLLEVSKLRQIARQIPINDRINPDAEFERDYIPLPSLE